MATSEAEISRLHFQTNIKTTCVLILVFTACLLSPFLRCRDVCIIERVSQAMRENCRQLVVEIDAEYTREGHIVEINVINEDLLFYLKRSGMQHISNTGMTITDTDRQKINELRVLVKDHLTPYYDTDFNLLRWLKGHDYNLEVIKPKLINHLILRELWNLDQLADQPRNHPIHKYWKCGLTAEAVKTPNCVVNIEQSGTNDYWGMLHVYSTTEVLRARMHDLESMLRAVMEMEKRTGEQCAILYIMDLTGLKLDRRCMTLVTGGLSAISAFMAEHYVEMVHSFVLVNVPSFISAVWTVARPLLPEKTRNKVNILGSHWRDEILKIADAACLPTYWNEEGKNEPYLAPVERGLVYSPDEYYKGEIPPTAKSIQVPPGKSGYFDVEAEEGQRLSWEIHADGDFAFTVYELNKVEEADSAAQVQKFYPMFSKVPGPTFVPLTDNFDAPRTGTYRFWFGNQHAWFHLLKIHYVVTIEESQPVSI